VGALALVVAAAVWASGGAVVKVEKTKNPKVVTNAYGHTLYVFCADHGITSACNGSRWAARVRLTGL
jgi:predicted lipoprotein with Yx(FWY)xxD motif